MKNVLQSLMQPGGLRPFCQPIIDVSGAAPQVHGIECLTRGPEGTPFERPDVLFDYVRKKGVEALVDTRCVDVALAACKELSRDTRLSLNVHAATLSLETLFTDHLLRMAEFYRLGLDRITVEIVEHAPRWNRRSFLDNLALLRAAGLKIALDDIGMGDSNLRMILDAHPESFKVDAYIVQGIHADPARRMVLRSIVTLARDFGSEVVAEGVENEADLRAVQDEGVHLVQGYLFSTPISIPVFMVRRSLLDPDSGFPRQTAFDLEEDKCVTRTSLPISVMSKQNCGH